MRAPRAARIAFLGTSITNGTPLDSKQVFTSLLEQRVKGLLPEGVCVDNRAVEAFGLDQELAVAREHVPHDRPALVFVEIWDPAKRYIVIGSSAYGLQGLATDDAGYPFLPAVPPSIAHPLFRASRLYEYATIALGVERPAVPVLSPDGPCPRQLLALAALARDSGSRLVAFLPAMLSRPFSESIRMPIVATITDCARSLSIPVISLAEDLLGYDVERVRRDVCCHFNATGHAILAEKFERHVRDYLPKSAAANHDAGQGLEVPP
ncbi:MAG TPA: hypothetical protein VGP93_18825 [Polyangiaceae bacterium]|nr:hypothetical protein [Polyangiaceae bacterium]